MTEKKEINVQVGREIKEARRAIGLTQERFAEMIDVTPQYVSDLERGRVGVSISTLKRICLILSVSSDDIIFGRKQVDKLDHITNQLMNIDACYLPMLDGIIQQFVAAISLENS